MPAPAFPPCENTGCPEAALSFSSCCWEHADRPAALKALRDGLRDLPAADNMPLNLKKVEVSGLDLSNRRLTQSCFSMARLEHCLFIGADLSSSEGIGARFNRCDFVGGDLTASDLTKAAFSHCSFSHADLRGACLAEIHFQETDLMGAMLHQCVVWNADLAGAKNLKKKSFADPHSKREPKEAGISEKNAVVAFDSYRALKHHFYRNGLHEDGSWAAYRELTMERKHFFETRDPRFIPSLLMDLLSGYTEKPNRAITASLVIIFAFALIYFAFDAIIHTSVGGSAWSRLWDCLYFSFITFTTVGYGDIVPKPVPWFRALACVEAFSGPFMAGLYIFTLTRRYSAT